MKRYPIRQDRLPFLSIQEKAERRLLSDALSIKDIGSLWLEGKHERYCFYADIIENCKAGIIKYCGDIDDLDVNVEAWQSGYYAQKYPNTPYESLNYLEKADRDKESMGAYWKAFDKGDIFEISNPPKCLIHRDDFKVYLQMENAWPVTDCLLANWWSESEQQIELLNERQKAIAQIKASSATNSNLTTQQLLDKPVSEIVENSRLLNAKDFDYFFNLFVWRRQLVQEQQIPQSRYPNKKDYDERMQSVNAKVEEIDRYINNQPVSNTTAKSVVEWNETLNNGEPINWGFWLGLENIRPEQAAKLTHNIDPRVWHDDKYAAGGPYGGRCNGDKIDNELLIKIRSLEQQLDNRSQQLDNRSKNWSLASLVSFLGEENAPLGMLEAVKELTESEPVSIMTDDKGSQADIESASVKAIEANSKGLNTSGLLNEPLKKDDWFNVIDDMTIAFFKKYGRLPNETQAWGRLSTVPPEGYAISTDTDRGEDCLNMPGAKPLSRTAFSKRWTKYTTNKT